MRKELEILIKRHKSDQKTLEKKKENKDKLLKKIDELELKYKEVCQKCSVNPIQRPKFIVSSEEIDFSTPLNKSTVPRAKSDANLFKANKRKVIFINTFLKQNNLKQN